MSQISRQISRVFQAFWAQPYYYILPLIVFLLPYERIPSFEVGGATVRLSQVASLVLIVISLPWLLKNLKRFVKLPYMWLALFLASYSLSTILASNHSLSLKTLIFTAFTILVGVLFSIFVDNKNLPRIERWLCFTTWVVIIFGLFQYFGDLAGISMKLTGLSPNYVKAVFGFPRIQSTALEPLYFASFLLIPFGILSVQQLNGNYKRTKLLFFIMLIIILTVSRGALYGSICAVVFLLITLSLARKIAWRRLARYGAIIAVASLIAFTMTKLPETNKGLTNAQKKARSHKFIRQSFNLDSQDDRVRNRIYAVGAFKQSPLFGIGPGNFDDYAKARYIPYQAAPKVIVNNEPLELLAEGGLISTVFIAAFFINLFYLVWQARKKVSTELMPWLYGLSAFLVAIAVQYQTFSTLYVMHFWVAIGLLLGVVGLSTKVSDKNNRIKAVT